MSPFLRTIVDALDKLYDNNLTTSCFIKYDDLVNLFYRRFRTLGWSKVELLALNNDIAVFKELRVDCLEQYQPSGMMTKKRHALDHVKDAKRKVGSIEYLHARLYESAHKRFKAMM